MNPATSPSVTASAAASSKRFAGAQELRPYVIVGDIGKGSFATVYKGYHEVTPIPPFPVSLLTLCATGNSPAGCRQDCCHR